MKKIISTQQAPQAIGPYSQAVQVQAGTHIFLSGQIPLDPVTMQLVTGSQEAKIKRVFDNLQAVATAAGGDLNNIVKLNIFLTDLDWFASVNTIMADYFSQPYPARAAIGVAALPKNAQIEMDAVMHLP